MSRHFCCCIPVRFGVFILTLVSFLSAGFGAVVLWALVHCEFRRELGSVLLQTLTGLYSVIVTDQLDKVQQNLTDEQKRALDVLLHSNKWIFIVAAILTTIVALFSFFGYVYASELRN